ncbi:hypothetical protein AAFF_G00259420 [Aldrovandia affinis]|uniref:Uncharacterized protein n=1 Tax=Aldrovandia affinis TaxID=143900 RepID=A0AAD7RCF9_9TELE|nr:hypothetical protein AAFF_G00259420 [Aldrovandia affinis]
MRATMGLTGQGLSKPEVKSVKTAHALLLLRSSSSAMSADSHGGCCCCSRSWRRSCCSRSCAYTLTLGLGFVTLGTSRILLLKFSENAENQYDYLPASVNLFAEALKLAFCLVMSVRVMIQEGRGCRAWASCGSWSAVFGLVKWSVPAFLYFLDNLIIFYVLSYLQPEAPVLGSVGVSAHPLPLHRFPDDGRRWRREPASHCRRGDQRRSPRPAVCCPRWWGGPPPVQQLPAGGGGGVGGGPRGRLENGSMWREGEVGTSWPHTLNGLGLGHALLLLQCFISSLANIYNEKILKEDVVHADDQSGSGGGSGGESIFVQNSKLYAFGLLFNGLSLCVHAPSRARVVRCGLLYGHSGYSAALACVTAALGLSVAFILKFRDNMFHVLTGQLTTVLVGVMSMVLFRGDGGDGGGFRPSLDFLLRAPCVPLAIFVYSAGRASTPDDGGGADGDRW